MHAFKLVSDLL